MYIQFKSLEWKNISSYGNELTKIDFESGLNVLTGKSGSGKSSLINILCFNLFGEPFSKKVNLNKIINRTNKKGAYCRSVLQIGNNTIEIERQLKPDKLKIVQNEKEIDLLSSKKLNQEEINKILGIDVTLFRQRIGLSISNNKSFLSLTVPQKREILESLFNIKIFSDMDKTVKKKMSKLKIDQEVNGKGTFMFKNNLESNLHSYKNNVKTFENFERDKKIRIDTYKKQVEVRNKKIENIQSKIDQNKKELGDVIEKIDLSDLESDINKNRQLAGKVSAKIDIINKNIRKLNIDGNCPTCGQIVTKEHKEKEMVVFNADKEKYKKSSVKIENKIDKLEKEKNESKNKNSLILENKNLQNDINRFKDEIRGIEGQILEEESRELNLNLSSQKLFIKELKGKYDQNKKTLEKCNSDLELYSIVQKIISDKGIKTYFFKKLAPMMNDRVNFYLDLFNFPIVVFFDELMQEKIYNASKQEIGYYEFSEGEKKRIEISIILSFIDLTSIVFNFNCNLIFLDEILDSSLDSEGLQHLINCIQQIVDKDQKLGMYLISHRVDLDNELFNHKYQFVKKDGFSNMEKVR